mgnify:CR=1 FL=1
MKNVVDTLCENSRLAKGKRVFYSASPLDFKYVFQIQDALRKKEELFFAETRAAAKRNVRYEKMHHRADRGERQNVIVSI